MGVRRVFRCWRRNRQRKHVMIFSHSKQHHLLSIAATSTPPIVVVAFDYDPLAHGYIRTLARPGGNVTGLFVQQIEQAVKRLELIREAFPKAQAATVLWDKLSFDQWEAVDKAAKTLTRAEAWPPRACSLQHRELMAQDDKFQQEVAAPAEPRPHGRKPSKDPSHHSL
jgi:ABC transporter substrate binding protein